MMMRERLHDGASCAHVTLFRWSAGQTVAVCSGDARRDSVDSTAAHHVAAFRGRQAAAGIYDAYDEHANLIWIRFNEALRSGNVPVREGRFGARMRIGSIADGPFQFTLQE